MKCNLDIRDDSWFKNNGMFFSLVCEQDLMALNNNYDVIIELKDDEKNKKLKAIQAIFFDFNFQSCVISPPKVPTPLDFNIMIYNEVDNISSDWTTDEKVNLLFRMVFRSLMEFSTISFRLLEYIGKYYKILSKQRQEEEEKEEEEQQKQQKKHKKQDISQTVKFDDEIQKQIINITSGIGRMQVIDKDNIIIKDFKIEKDLIIEIPINHTYNICY